MRMKKFLSLISACCAATLIVPFSGCNVQPYFFCTNIPEENYVVLAGNYSAVDYDGEPFKGEFLNTVDGAENKDAFTSKQKTEYVMGTWANLVVSDDFSSEEKVSAFKGLETAVSALLADVENSVSVQKEESCIIGFNSASAGAKVKIDKISYEILSAALEMYSFTEGYYNPAVYYSLRDFGFYGQYELMTEENLPSEGALEKYVRLSSHFGEIKLSEEEDGYYAVKPDYTEELNGETLSLKIDLGGIGKGYVADRVNGLMDEYGFAYGNFNFGSSSMAVKKHYSGGSYSIGLIDPRARESGSVYFCFSAANALISTSGDYERYYEIGGVRYSHIINPFTGKPSRTGITSATVIGGSTAENDAVTTALICMGKEKAVQFINANLSGRNAVFALEETPLQ